MTTKKTAYLAKVATGSYDADDFRTEVAPVLARIKTGSDIALRLKEVKNFKTGQSYFYPTMDGAYPEYLTKAQFKRVVKAVDAAPFIDAHILNENYASL